MHSSSAAATSRGLRGCGRVAAVRGTPPRDPWPGPDFRETRGPPVIRRGMTNRGTALLVLHGKAAMRDDVRQAVHAGREEGFRVDVHVTWEPGDAARFAEEAARAGYEIVLAGGGDGTVNEVVAGMLRGAADASPLFGESRRGIRGRVRISVRRGGRRLFVEA